MVSRSKSSNIRPIRVQKYSEFRPGGDAFGQDVQRIGRRHLVAVGIVAALSAEELALLSVEKEYLYARYTHQKLYDHDR
jgi:hypothetical protein